MKRVLLLVGVLLATSASAGDVVAGVRARLEDAPLLRGEFEQKKTVTGFKKPLVSRGDFLLSREKGVLWDTRVPFASTLTLTRTSLKAEQGTGGAAYQLDTGREPALAAMNALLFALLSGDVATLATRFRIEGELVGTEGWKLALTPTDASLARVFRNIRLEGDRFVRQVHLEETRGDSSVIQFSHLASTPPLSDTEAKRLAK
ncbi:outer membrane lipoprotein carrier protein LolA [Pyxidicoccus xibeiensis]|uniref:outer membrane lipoprotein carrier protein LolA n=1 Tax=Pyxidicoccus xibeiensis TaxID=2906759 RepID=UPI0020A78BBD|nr:outer membrane lipoprotein carrier protein LolA [Pyxidicoccus xibeiensis]MCP3140990.1 outer membrane lipoprotein carrier protein LolA [Pyxidicoccus xibeiensis]